MTKVRIPVFYCFLGLFADNQKVRILTTVCPHTAQGRPKMRSSPGTSSSATMRMRGGRPAITRRPTKHQAAASTLDSILLQVRQ
jgi:hypothetical protein